ncbi:peptidoglycan-binding domain-containing protein [Streptomyces aidingensis]|uniref:Putative peptidoglycan binding domain-containing protein n=1 Tax=Streptomyces aidingensis TaxID=910347 RepID=A0A1I1LB54_9ACTN|nr:peptidoglycan-binding domain-containing protein [Streptomyces aidingensis]SFC67613.1 Putative peptidoglycan binding domain-containing protein [Streptomyces aidingensis]
MAETGSACAFCGGPDCRDGCPRRAEPAAGPALYGTVAADDRPLTADPADLALFSDSGADDTVVLAPVPAGSAGRSGRPRRSRTGRTGRRGRLRAAALAAGTVGVVMGCTAVVSALITGGGDGTPDRAEETARPKPSLALPDGGLAESPDTGEVDSPSPEEELLSASPTASPTASATTGSEPTGPGGTAPETSPAPEPSATRSPSPTTPAPTATATGDGDGEPDEAPVLRRGDSGPAVEELQLRLRQVPHIYDGEITGDFGRRTEEAVSRFQWWYGVHGDEPGVYGPRTRDRLEEITHHGGDGDRDGDWDGDRGGNP